MIRGSFYKLNAQLEACLYSNEKIDNSTDAYQTIVSKFIERVSQVRNIADLDSARSTLGKLQETKKLLNSSIHSVANKIFIESQLELARKEYLKAEFSLQNKDNAEIVKKICTALDSQQINETINPAPPGKLIDVGGHQMHIHITGERHGPAIILEGGLGANCLAWSKIQPEVSTFTQVCSYDRAGLGWSEKSPLTRTGQNIVNELHALLKNANIPPPYVLVGHSLGGVYMQLFANTFPEQVFGIILVDSSHEDQMQRMPKEPYHFYLDPDLSPLCATQGVFEVLNNYGLIVTSELERSPKAIQAMTQEYAHIKESLEQLKDAHPSLSEKHLTVITANTPRADQNIWTQLQEDLVSKSMQGKHVKSISGHDIPQENPTVVINAIKEILIKAR